jgi:hypothetical protein
MVEELDLPTNLARGDLRGVDIDVRATTASSTSAVSW